MLADAKTDLWFGTRGRPDAPIVLVGEAWGSEEARLQKPFVGEAGKELDRILSLAGVPYNDVLFTNLIPSQPRGNEMWRFFTPKAEHGTAGRIRGLAPKHELRESISRLYNQISASPRQLIIAAGNYPLWAFSSVTGAKVQSQSNNRLIPPDLQTWSPSGILDWRGSMLFAEPIVDFNPARDILSEFQGGTKGGIKLLPIVHPAAILRAWYLRDPTIHDLKKRVPLALANDWRPSPDYEFFAPPSFKECITILSEWLRRARVGQIRLAIDIETARGLITCLGIADSDRVAMSIPFIRRTGPEKGAFDSWWTPFEEAEIVKLLRTLLTHPSVFIIGQNFIYDTQYIQRWLGVTPYLTHDTMLHQNVCFPGTPKALEYLSSLYCKYHWYWKEDHKEWDERGTIEDLLVYNCMDCVRTWEIGQNQMLVTEALGMEAQFQFKMETNALCLRMMNRGVLFDGKRRGELLYELQEVLQTLYKELLEIIPQEWIGPPGKRARDKSPIYWMTSDKQQKFLFYEFLGFKSVKDPKTGQLTSGKKALGQFRLWYPEFTGLIDRIKMAATIENTINVLKSEIDHDGRIRCSYNPGGAETHRLSSSTNAFGGGTNLQNLTKGEEDE